VQRLDRLSRRFHPIVLDQFLHLGGVVPADAAGAGEFAERLRAALKAAAPDLDLRSVACRPGADAATIEVRTVSAGVDLTTVLGGVESGEEQEALARLAGMREELARQVPLPARVADGPERMLYAELRRDVLLAAERGFDIQRYKGLGEMSAEQLWETTLDPDVRTLQQVEIRDVVEADHWFSVLMGDAVEPRRDFIQQHALDVRNLDI
jgi:DNA gyrase subunit B